MREPFLRQQDTYSAARFTRQVQNKTAEG